jgi:membrane protease YdiL (CAAX protease family)
LLKVATRRYANLFALQMLSRKKKEAKREATARKGRKGVIAPILLAILITSGITSMMFSWLSSLGPVLGARDLNGRAYLQQSVWLELSELPAKALEEQLRYEEGEGDVARVPEPLEFFRARLSDAALPQWLVTERADEYAKIYAERGLDGFSAGLNSAYGRSRWDGKSQRLLGNLVATVLLLSWVTLTLLGLGMANKDLGAVEWKFEWLYSLPASARSLFLSRILELTLLNTTGWVLYLAFFLAIFVNVGYGWSSCWLALVCAFGSNLFIGSTRAAGETLLRRFLSMSAIKNVQALCTVLGFAGMLALYSVVLRDQMPGAVLEWIHAAPRFLSWLPVSVASGLVDPSRLTGQLMAFIASGGVGAFLAMAISEISVRRGLMRSGAHVSGVRGAAVKPDRAGFFRGMIAKEIRLLMRDRAFLVQVLFVPLFMIGMQLILYPELFGNLGENKPKGLTLAFGIGAYVLLLCAPNIFSSEKATLWLLYTLPHRIEAILRRKVFLWAWIALLYSGGGLVLMWSQATSVEFSHLGGTAMVLVGVPIFALLASGQVILGADPLAQEEQRRIRPTTIYYIMVAAAVYSFGFYQSVWQQLPLVVLFALLALSIWQRVRDHAPYLLDPTELPPPAISLSDGLGAGLLFFVLQTAIATAFSQVLPTGLLMLLAFSLAGLLVFAALMLVLWRRKVPQLLIALGVRSSESHARPLWFTAFIGLACGALAGVAALGYSTLSESIEWLHSLRMGSESGGANVPGDLYLWIAAIAILAAPIFEEFIFRALIYRGLRRTWSAPVAILASAGIFAIVHPSYSVIPVFGLGLAAAFAFEKGQRLLAPILCHAMYNAMVLLLTG